MTIEIPLYIDIWADGEYVVHDAKDGKEPAPPQNILGGWKRYKVMVPVPMPVPVDGTAKVSYEGVTTRRPGDGK